MSAPGRDFGTPNKCECGWAVHLPGCLTGERAKRLADADLVTRTFRQIVRSGGPAHWTLGVVADVMGREWVDAVLAEPAEP